MNISNDAPPVDHIAYITKQLPKDLVKLIEVRDELAKRQGAMAAVEAAIMQKAEADVYYANTKVAVDKLLVDTTEVNKLARDKKRKLDELDMALAKRESEIDSKHAKKAAELDAREKALAARTTKQDNQAVDLTAREEQLMCMRAEHEARVKAFQEKVAQITA